MLNWIRERPLLAAILAFAFGAAPQWLASVWSLFSSEPLFMWAARQRFLPQLAFSVSWLTWPISIGLLVAIFVVARTGKRAELTPFSTKISRINGGYKLAVGVKNTGNRKAIDAQITTVFWRCSGQRKPFTVRKSNANPISKDVLEQVELDFTMEPLEPVFVVMSFAYRSRERGKLKEQHPSFYYKWNGSDSSLVHASKEEREQIIRRLKNRNTVPPAIEFQGDFEKKSSTESRFRTITFDQESAIVKLLKGVPLRPIWFTTRMGTRENDKEAHDFAMQLTRVFTKAGVPIEGQASVDVGTLFPNGVSIFWKKAIYNDVSASSIIDALRITGVECKEVDRQVCVTHGKEPEINLMIGSNEIQRPS